MDRSDGETVTVNKPVSGEEWEATVSFWEDVMLQKKSAEQDWKRLIPPLILPRFVRSKNIPHGKKKRKTANFKNCDVISDYFFICSDNYQ